MPTRENYEPLTPIDFLKRNAVVFKNKTAVVYEDKRYTYQEFYQRVNRLASALSKIGIQKGDKVAFICPNTPPMLEAHYGVPMVGAALVSVNIRLSPNEVTYIINHSDAKAVFVDMEFAQVIQKDALPNVQTIVNICDNTEEKVFPGLTYEEFLQTGTPEPYPAMLEDELETIAINYTSGTTGQPKGVMYSHRGAYLNAMGEALHHQMNAESVYLWALPMFHCNGWCFTWAVTAVGATHICLRKVVPEEIYRLIELETVSHICAAPTVLISMSSYEKAKECTMNVPLTVITAGAPPSPTVIKNMEAIGVIVTQVYGLTEVYGPHCICQWQNEWNALETDEKVKLKACQGVPYVTAEFVDVVYPGNPDMESVPWDGNTLGEIVMRGNNVMKGYYKQPESTAEAFRGGWFHTGDLAVRHPNGYIEIKDRMKDIIISGGENISTVEIENLLYQHPDVQEVAVVAIPDTKWGEVPKAFIVPKPNANPTKEDIIQFCRARIARFKVPKVIEFGDLPKTSTGKIMKFKLREQEWVGYDKKVN